MSGGRFIAEDQGDGAAPVLLLGWDQRLSPVRRARPVIRDVLETSLMLARDQAKTGGRVLPAFEERLMLGRYLMTGRVA